MSLKALVDRYFDTAYRPNPPLDPEALFNDFLAQVQRQGKDLSEYDESDWRTVLPDFGLDDADRAIDALENLAGWGVVDDFVWESDVEEEIEEGIER